jgi:membrane-associated protease RseP (regulator of RpoE activity)
MNGPVSPMHDLDDPRKVFVFHPPPRRYWLHILLFLLSVLTTLIVGARLQQNFLAGDNSFLADNGFFPVQWLWRDPHLLLSGIPFSVTLLGILLAHEMGHFFYSVKHGVYATLPYFLPGPFISPIGTFGAFIKIRSPFRSRAALLEIGIAGPIAGFLVAIPAAAIGLALSHRAASDFDPAGQVGIPLIFDLIHAAFGWVNGAAAQTPLQLTEFHPVAIAAWVGMLATSLNLLPGGQLDGGHILFAWNAEAHRKFTLAAMFVLFVLALFAWSGWLIWIFALWLTRRHPPVPQWPDLDVSRRRLLLVALLIFALTFMPAPIPGGGLWHAISNIHL